MLFSIVQTSVMLPMMFVHDFGDQIGQYVTMVDPRNNKFEVMVERNNIGIYLTRGWGALCDFYRLKLGAWISIVFVGNGRFNIKVRNRLGKKICVPLFSPPMEFYVYRNVVPITLFNVVPAPFVHDELNFQHTYEKMLDADEMNAGILVIYISNKLYLYLHMLSCCVLILCASFPLNL